MDLALIFQSAAIAVWISFSSLTKLVSLSNLVTSSCPRRSTYLLRTCRKDLVCRLWTIPMWVALMTRHFLLSRKGQSSRNQRMWKEVSHLKNDVLANQPFSFFPPLPVTFYYWHFFTRSLSIRAASTLQYLSLVNSRTCSTSLCWAISWWCPANYFDTGLSLGLNILCFPSMGVGAFLRHPPTWISSPFDCVFISW